ncbi:MAG: hypothetical protein RIT81_16495 [Deltaproteobacteria bacterium]
MTFPKPLENRPGLDTVDYRRGTYDEIRAWLFARLDEVPELAGWTYRGADDPGIALLEGGALVAHVLSLYQHVYANEAYLRTAKWRESVAELVRLYGYRLTPAVGGRATFALQARGDRPVEVPAGTSFKVDVDSGPPTAELESTEASWAVPALSRFRLYAPFANRALPAGARRLRVDFNASGRAAENLRLKAGDRLLVIAFNSGSIEADVTANATSAQIVTIAEVTTPEAPDALEGEVLLDFDDLDVGTPSRILAYRLGGSYRHFGHSAPTPYVKPGTDPIVSVDLDAADFDRSATGLSTTDGPKPTLRSGELLLDREVDVLTPGRRIAVQIGDPQKVLVRRIQSVEARSEQFFAIAGASTAVRINTFPAGTYDIRTIAVHEITSPPLVLRAPPAPTSGSERTVRWAGTAADAAHLEGRRLQIVSDDGVVDRTVTSVDLASWAGRRTWWDVRLDEPVRYVDFPLASPTREVFGNLVDTTQGKTEAEAVLGSGDARQPWQSFKIPKAPLTFLLRASATPPTVPELEVFVDGRRYERVESFYGRGPAEEIYIVREDDEGNAWIQGGDGRTGARFPTGRKNIVARFRTGAAAYGALQPGKSVAIGQRVPGIEKAFLHDVVSGGAERESSTNAREAAPKTLQTLGRIVSLADIEAEVSAIGGVERAAARWDLVEGVPGVVVTVLMTAGREPELDDVRSTLATANRCRGADRHAIHVVAGSFLDAYAEVELALDPAFVADDVFAAVRAALGQTDRDGLFSVRRRDFGAPEYASRIAATAHNVDGVRWARVVRLGTFTDASAGPPSVWASNERINGGPHSILRLATQVPYETLVLRTVTAPTEACS